MRLIPLPLSAVSFAVNTTATVVEGDTEMMICVRMTAIPSEALLDKEVLVSLSTEDGTGESACMHMASA